MLIRDLNPILRGWGGYFRTGNAAKNFNRVDQYVTERLRGFLVKRKGRNLRPGQEIRMHGLKGGFDSQPDGLPSETR